MQAQVYSPDEEFYPTDMPDDLEQRVAEAVQAVASTALGEATKTFLDVEELSSFVLQIGFFYSMSSE